MKRSIRGYWQFTDFFQRHCEDGIGNDLQRTRKKWGELTNLCSGAFSTPGLGYLGALELCQMDY